MSTLNRRSLTLGLVAAIAATTIAPIALAAHPDAELLAAAATVEEAVPLINSGIDEEADRDACGPSVTISSSIKVNARGSYQHYAELQANLF